MVKRKKKAPVWTPPEELIELMGRQPSSEALEFIGVSRATWQRWIRQEKPVVPAAVLRLMRFRRYLELGEILGKEWHGFIAQGGHLQIPGMRRAITARELSGLWLWQSQRAALDVELAQARRDLERAETALQEAQKASDWYRHQLRLESGLGMMLARLAA